MSRLFRWLLYILGFFVFLLAIAYGTAQYYRPRILEALNTELNNSINGEFKIGDLDFTVFERFPNISISVKDAYLRGPYYNRYHHDLFSTNRVYVHIGLLELFRGTVSLKSLVVKGGTIFIYRTKDGTTNLDAFAKPGKPKVEKAAPGSGPSIALERVQFQDTRFSFIDSLKEKSFDIQFLRTNIQIERSDSSRQVTMAGKMHFGGLVFNGKKGGYLVDTPTEAMLNLEFMPGRKQLVIHPSELAFERSAVQLKGQFNFSSPGDFQLSIASDKLDYDEALTLLTRALQEKLSRYQLKGPVEISVNLIGTLAPGAEPRIDIHFATANSSFATGRIKASDLSFDGSFTNHVDSTKDFNDANSRLRMDSLSAKLMNVPVEAKVTITDLKNPHLLLESRSRLNLQDLNHESDTARIRFLSGVASADVAFDGALKEYMDTLRTSYTGKLKGRVTITNGSAELKSQAKKFEQINFQVRFDEKRMELDKMNLVVNGNAIQLKGSVDGFVPFFLVPSEKGYVNLSVYSPRLDLASLKKNKTNVPRIAKVSKGTGRRKISNLLDVLNHKMNFDLAIKVDEMVSGPFKANQVIGKITMNKDRFAARPLSMKFADGTVGLSLELTELDQPVNPMVLTADIKDADIRKFFAGFNNFSQGTIKSDNLSGTIQSHVQMNALVDDQFMVIRPTMRGNVDFKLQNGKLSDFEPLQNMSNFLFKKRDFSDVDFAEVNCNFKLLGSTLDIGRMEVQSSVVTLFLEGRYSLVDSTDLSIQVPLSNLKKRDKNYVPENVGTDAKVGPSVFLRASKNKDGKMSITYDPFKKFKKKK
jgi:hypothetical protein